MHRGPFARFACLGLFVAGLAACHHYPRASVGHNRVSDDPDDGREYVDVGGWFHVVVPAKPSSEFTFTLDLPRVGVDMKGLVVSDAAAEYVVFWGRAPDYDSTEALFAGLLHKWRVTPGITLAEQHEGVVAGRPALFLEATLDRAVEWTTCRTACDARAVVIALPKPGAFVLIIAGARTPTSSNGTSEGLAKIASSFGLPS